MSTFYKQAHIFFSLFSLLPTSIFELNLPLKAICSLSRTVYVKSGHIVITSLKTFRNSWSVASVDDFMLYWWLMKNIRCGKKRFCYEVYTLGKGFVMKNISCREKGFCGGYSSWKGFVVRKNVRDICCDKDSLWKILAVERKVFVGDISLEKDSLWGKNEFCWKRIFVVKKICCGEKKGFGMRIVCCK